MRKTQYNTELGKLTLEAVKKQFGLFRLVEISRKLGRNRSSVIYQLRKLVREGVLARVKKYYVLVCQMSKKVVFHSVRKVLLDTTNLYKMRKMGWKLSPFEWFRLKPHIVSYESR